MKEDQSVVEKAISSSIGRFGHTVLRAAQAEAVTKVLEGHDVFVSVPTGYGKSLVYQLLPFCVEEILKRAGREVSLTPCVLVLSPLTALMSDQNSKMKTVTGANSVLLAKDQISISSMNCTHIFASPEALFHTDNGRRLLLSESFVNSLVAVAIDEAHCIVKWYVSENLAHVLLHTHHLYSNYIIIIIIIIIIGDWNHHSGSGMAEFHIYDHSFRIRHQL